MVGERLPDSLGGKPVFASIEDRISGRANRIRNSPGEVLEGSFPDAPAANLGEGQLLGILESGVLVVIDEVVGVPFGSDADVVDTETDGDGVIYTINVDAPTENMAEGRSFLDATTGFTSILTDEMDVQDVQIINERVLRDTYQVEIRVEE